MRWRLRRAGGDCGRGVYGEVGLGQFEFQEIRPPGEVERAGVRGEAFPLFAIAGAGCLECTPWSGPRIRAGGKSLISSKLLRCCGVLKSAGLTPGRRTLWPGHFGNRSAGILEIGAQQA